MDKRLRHLTYWAIVAVVFLPVTVLVLLRTLYDVTEVGMDRVRYWAYKERYYSFPYHGKGENDDSSQR